MDKKQSSEKDSPDSAVEAKVKKMLDPRLPDEPSQGPKPQGLASPEETSAPSAPELPGASQPASKKTTEDLQGNTVLTSHGDPDAIAQELDQSIAGFNGNAAEPPDIEAHDDPALSRLTDIETDQAVDEILAEESDILLEVDDAMIDNGEPVKSGGKLHQNLLDTLKRWWAIPKVRWGIIIGSGLVVLALILLPATRYFALNTVGVRAASSMTVVDSGTQLPLKNVQVKIGGASAITDADGKAKLSRVRLGSNKLKVEKRGFAAIEKDVTLGWGSNPLGGFSLTPTGSQYSFTIVDFLSGKAIGKIEASSNEASAISDDKGLIKLTVGGSEEPKLTISIKGESYRTEQLVIDPNDKSNRVVKLVPARKHAFISKRSGKFDIYSIYADGKEEKLVLAGSGKEREDMALVPHATSDTAAFVSTRAGQRNKDGYLLSNLILINTKDNTTSSIVVSERVQILGWSGNHLVYLQVAAGASANDAKRYRLMSYHLLDDTNNELASSNYFNAALLAGNQIYYAPSSASQAGTASLFRVSPSGTSSQSVLAQEVWNILRSSYDHLNLATEKDWYDLALGEKAPTKLSSPPVSQNQRLYIDSPDGKRSVWVDSRDGKGVLISYDTTAKTDKSLRSQSGLGHPVSWLGDKVLVYRVRTDQETADYAINVDGGEPVKLRDVTNASASFY